MMGAGRRIKDYLRRPNRHGESSIIRKGFKLRRAIPKYYLENINMTRTEALATLAGLLTAVTPLRAIELTQPAGVLHGYPAMRELDGKLLGRGEFT